MISQCYHRVCKRVSEAKKINKARNNNKAFTVRTFKVCGGDDNERNDPGLFFVV